MSDKIEFIDLKTQYASLKAVINQRIQTVLEHGQYIMGPETRELEEQLQRHTGAEHCITVASGTEALLISLLALGIKAGDEVITTPFTFAATAETIALLGAIPVFVDIDQDTCNINPKLIEQAITPKTKAIIPVSLYGQVADLDEINQIAAAHGNIPVIEDAAQSFGATYKGKKSCNLSTIGCTSFFPSKPLGCYGDGGAIFTNDANLAKSMREIRVHGQERRYYHTQIGVGGRMDTIQCAIVLAKLTQFDWEIEQRARAATYYQQQLESINNVTLPTIKPECTSAWAQFTVFVRNRDELHNKLKIENIPTAIHYPMPLHHQPAFEKISVVSGGSLDNADTIAKLVLSLPLHPYLERHTQDTIIDALRTLLT